MSDAITLDNVRQWYSAPTTENPLAGEPFYQLETVGLAVALQILRLVPESNTQQEALHHLRLAIDLATRGVPHPNPEELDLRMRQSLAPYAPSTPQDIDDMLTLAGVKPNETVLDLGCGDGRVLCAAALKYGAYGLGFDIDGAICEVARDMAHRLGLNYRITIHHMDVSRAWSLVKIADVVTCFLTSRGMEMIETDLRANLKPGARVVSNGFTFMHWVPFGRTRQAYLYV